MSKYIPIVFCFDHKYSIYAAVSIFSVLSTTDVPVKVYCIVPSSDVDNVSSSLQGLNRISPYSITVIGGDDVRFQEWKEVAHISRATYLRLLIPDLIKEDKVIYLDSDLLVLSGLSELYSIPTDQYFFAGVFDPAGASTSKLPRAAGDVYINAGVLVMNLDGLRRDRFLERCVEIHSSHPGLVTWLDQCLINKYAENKKVVIDPRWNRQVFAHAINQRDWTSIASSDGSSIIHFLGQVKPWSANCPSYIADFWGQYANNLHAKLGRTDISVSRNLSLGAPEYQLADVLRIRPNSAPASQLYVDLQSRAAARQLSMGDLIVGAELLSSQGERQAAADLYKSWIVHNPGHEVLYAIWFNCGAALMAARDYPGSIAAFSEAIRLKPDFHIAYINVGRVLEENGQRDEAVEQWLKLVKNLAVVNGETVKHKTTVLQQVGRVLEAAKNDAAAESALKQSLDINPNQPEIVQHWISLRAKQCKWPVLEESEHICRKHLLTQIDPLGLECLSDDPMFQLAKAYHHARNVVGIPTSRRRPPPVRPRENKTLRIGYVSSDLRGHAVGFAMTDVIELHDRKSFEIYAYYCGINHTDPTQQRIMKSVDHWVDINGMNDEQAAAKIAADGVDILVDLNGYTRDARTRVFALRPAPITVNWFGFPGTMGTPYHHYIIADGTIIPPEDEIYYSEKVMRLPCYQPNDRKRTVAERRPSRAEVGLPENAFVYCSFNGTQKITPRVFQRWMAILGRVPNSVLWLLTGTDDTNARLKQAAAARGISPERLIIAERAANPEHIARYPLADLFLDSMPYGAHTTAADSLWMSVPILTLPGRTFAARVCASIVRAAGVPELVCATPEAYVARAVELAQKPERLAEIKQKLAANRDSCLLFDTPQLVGHLEGLYRQMWTDFKRGGLPVPDLRNLDVYHDIGLGLDIESIEMLSRDAYVALYAEKLADWDSNCPIESDIRLWGNGRIAQRDRLTVA